MRRTFILHANGSKLPSDLLGLTSVRYDPATSPAEVRAINEKLRKAIETEGRRGLVEDCGGSSRRPCGAKANRRR